MTNLRFTQNILDINRTAIEHAWNAASLVQDQVERISRAALDQRNAMAEVGGRVVEEWLKEYKKGQAVLKKTLDDNYEHFRSIVENTVPELKTKAETPKKK